MESREHMKPTDYTTILSKLTDEFPTVNPTLIDEPFMDLHVERHIEDDGAGNEIDVIYLSHTYLQNGDVMSDPHIRVMLNRDLKAASAIYYQQDALGIYQTIRGIFYREDGTEYLGINPKAEKSCNEFLLLWLDNIKNQGFDIKSLLSPIAA